MTMFKHASISRSSTSSHKARKRAYSTEKYSDIDDSQHGEEATKRSSFFSTTSSEDFSLDMSSSLTKPMKPRQSTVIQGRLDALNMNKIRFDPDRLYGRETETEEIQRSFKGIETGRNVTLIAGGPGIGKSVLATQLIKAARLKQGLCVQGKYDLEHRGNPYYAISHACQALCDTLIQYKGSSSGHANNSHSHTSNNNNGNNNNNNTAKLTPRTKSIISNASNHSSTAMKVSQESKINAATQICAELKKQLLFSEILLLSSTIPNIDQLLDINTNYSTQSRSSRDIMISTKTGSQRGQRTFGGGAQDRFKLVFRQFIRIIAAVSPVAIILDDLQWADSSSLELIESILKDEQMKGLMIMCTYRNNKEYQTELLQTSIRSLEAIQSKYEDVSMNHITLSNLSVDHIGIMLDDVLQSSSSISGVNDNIIQLAKSIHNKTQGNPFFVKQFLHLLVERDLLTFNLGTFTWSWDVNKVKEGTQATENVIDILQLKMRELPGNVCQVLPAMACLGSRFQSRVFKIIYDNRTDIGIDPMDDIDQDFEDDLMVCEQHGLIEEMGIGEYKWAHDKIREAASTLIEDAGSLINLQFNLAKLLLRALDPPDLDAMLFTVVNLHNTRANMILRSSPDRIEAIELNLWAGKKAAQASAFRQAADYFSKGIDLLPRDHWSEQTSLSLDLYSCAAEALMCIGSHQKAQEHCKVVVSQEHIDLFDKECVYNVMIESISLQDRMQDAMDLCLDVLSKLGSKFPKGNYKFHTIIGALRIMRTLKTAEPKSLLELPQMVDPSKLWTLKLIDKLATFAYLDSDIQAVAIFRGFSITLKYGISDEAPVLIALIAVTLTCHLGDFATGKKYSDSALAMIKTGDFPDQAARVYLLTQGLVQHWTTMIDRSRQTFLDGYQAGLNSGDTKNAFLCIYLYLEYRWRSGSCLTELAPNAQMYARQMVEFNDDKFRDYTWITLHNLTTMSGDTTCVDDDVPALATFKKSGQAHNVSTAYLTEMSLAFIFGDYDQLLVLIHESKMHKGSFKKSMLGLVGLYQLYFNNALGCISLYCRTGKRKYRNMAKTFTKQVRFWAKQGNPNLKHCMELLDAEWASVAGKSDAVAIEHYNNAIRLAGRTGVTHHHAIAQERTGCHYLRRGDRSNARYHLEKAVEQFDDWGAFAVSERLKERYADILRPPTEIMPSSNVDVGGGDDL